MVINCGKLISTVAVNFLDGTGYITIAPGSSASKTYTDSSGIKKFSIKVQCTDGSIYHCYSQQYVVVKTNGQAKYAPLSAAEIATPTFTIPAVAGQHYEGKVYIRYSSMRNGTALAGQLVKPYIIV